MSKIEKLYKLAPRDKTIFNLQNLSIIWDEPDKKKVREFANYYKTKNSLFRLNKGIYSLQKTLKSLN